MSLSISSAFRRQEAEEQKRIGKERNKVCTHGEECLADEVVRSQRGMMRWLFPQKKPKYEGVRETLPQSTFLSVSLVRLHQFQDSSFFCQISLKSTGKVSLFPCIHFYCCQVTDVPTIDPFT